MTISELLMVLKQFKLDLNEEYLYALLRNMGLAEIKGISIDSFVIEVKQWLD